MPKFQFDAEFCFTFFETRKMIWVNFTQVLENEKPAEIMEREGWVFSVSRNAGICNSLQKFSYRALPSKGIYYI